MTLETVAKRLATIIGKSQNEDSNGKYISGAQIANVYSQAHSERLPLNDDERVGQFLIRLSNEYGMIECKRPIGKPHMNVYLKSEEPIRPETDGSGSGSDSHQELTIIRLRLQVAELKAENARRSLEEENARLMKENARLKEENSRLKKQVSDDKVIIDALGKDLTHDRAKLAEKEAEIANLEEIRDALGKDLIHDRAKLADQEAEIANLQAEVARLKSGDEEADE